MEARMKNPAAIIPAAMKPIMELMKAAQSQGVPQELLELVHLRVSQINGCSPCVDSGLKSLRKLGESDERIGLVSAWREARTTPTPNGPRWSWRRPRPGWPTAPTPSPTWSGTTPPATSTRSSWPRSC